MVTGLSFKVLNNKWWLFSLNEGMEGEWWFSNMGNDDDPFHMSAEFN